MLTPDVAASAYPSETAHIQPIVAGELRLREMSRIISLTTDFDIGENQKRLIIPAKCSTSLFSNKAAR